MTKGLITWEDFEKLDIRVGTIISAESFPEAKKPALKLRIDFGAGTGIKRSSAQITAFYDPENLVGQQVAAVINFPPKQIAAFLSECLVLGVVDEAGRVTLLQPGRPVANGHVVA